MKTLAPFALILLLVWMAAAQDIKVSRGSNILKIARLWNSLLPASKDYNQHMNAADRLIHERFSPKIVVADPDAKRRETVGHLKAAREALDQEREAITQLIEEEDY